jgi:ABC-type glycerol-3-phosphate transport system substrate-binding protein
VVAESFRVALSVSGNLTGITRSAKDAQIKEAVYSNIQKALFGQMPAEQALAEAEKAVNRILAGQ